MTKTKKAKMKIKTIIKEKNLKKCVLNNEKNKLKP